MVSLCYLSTSPTLNNPVTCRCDLLLGDGAALLVPDVGRVVVHGVLHHTRPPGLTFTLAGAHLVDHAGEREGGRWLLCCCNTLPHQHINNKF